MADFDTDAVMHEGGASLVLKEGSGITLTPDGDDVIISSGGGPAPINIWESRAYWARVTRNFQYKNNQGIFMTLDPVWTSGPAAARNGGPGSFDLDTGSGGWNGPSAGIQIPVSYRTGHLIRVSGTSWLGKGIPSEQAPASGSFGPPLLAIDAFEMNWWTDSSNYIPVLNVNPTYCVAPVMTDNNPLNPSYTGLNRPTVVNWSLVVDPEVQSLTQMCATPVYWSDSRSSTSSGTEYVVNNLLIEVAAK